MLKFVIFQLKDEKFLIGNFNKGISQGVNKWERKVSQTKVYKLIHLK